MSLVLIKTNLWQKGGELETAGMRDSKTWERIHDAPSFQADAW